jgi:predicted nucleic acid-binding protein
MTTYLLDANVLIALTDRGHVHAARVGPWMAQVERFAVCPVVQSALVRYLVRNGESRPTITSALRVIAQRPGYEFWPDDTDYADLDLTTVQGHRQVTDTYLAALAGTHPDALLATLDKGLVSTHPTTATLIPPPPQPTSDQTP